MKILSDTDLVLHGSLTEVHSVVSVLRGPAVRGPEVRSLEPGENLVITVRLAILTVGLVVLTSQSCNNSQSCCLQSVLCQLSVILTDSLVFTVSQSYVNSQFI